MSLKAAAARGVAWTTLEKWGRQGLTFAIFVVLSRLLEPSDIGVITAAMVVIGVMELLTSQGFPTAIIQLRGVSDKHLDSVFVLSMCTAVVLALVTFLGAPWLASLLQRPDTAAVFQWLALLLPMAALTVVPTGLLRRDMRFNTLARRTLVSTLIGGILGVTMAFMGFGVWSLVYMYLASGVVGTIWLLGTVSWRPRICFSLQHIRDVLPVSASLLGMGLISLGYTRLDKAVIGGVLGAALLGQYAVGARVTQMVQDAVAAPLMAVAISTLSAVQNDVPRMLRAYYSLTNVATIVGFPVCVGVGLTAHLSIPLIFGHKWMSAVVITQVLCVTAALQVLYVGTHPLTVARGKAHLMLWLNAGHAVLAIAGAWIGSRWGINGVAVGVACAWISMALIGLAIMCRVLGVKVSLLIASARQAFLGCLVMTVATMGVMLLMQRQEILAWLQLIIASIVGALVYTGYLYISTPQPMAQVRELIRMLRSRAVIQEAVPAATTTGALGGG